MYVFLVYSSTLGLVASMFRMSVAPQDTMATCSLDYIIVIYLDDWDCRLDCNLLIILLTQQSAHCPLIQSSQNQCLSHLLLVSSPTLITL